MQNLANQLNKYVEYVAAKIQRSALSAEIQEEMIAAYKLLASKIANSGTVARNTAYESYENTPEIALDDAFEDQMPTLCPKAWALREERRLARLNSMD